MILKRLYLNIFLIIILNLSFSKLFSQESSLLFNSTTFSIYNPAYTGVDGSVVSFNTRSQWKNIEGAPRTNSLIYHMPQKKNVHLGFRIMCYYSYTVCNKKIYTRSNKHIIFYGRF